MYVYVSGYLDHMIVKLTSAHESRDSSKSGCYGSHMIHIRHVMVQTADHVFKQNAQVLVLLGPAGGNRWRGCVTGQGLAAMAVSLLLLAVTVCLAQSKPELTPSPPSAPPPHPPPAILPELTLNGSVPLEYYYVDDSNKGRGGWSMRLLLGVTQHSPMI